MDGYETRRIQILKKKNTENVRIIALGGVGEIGKNLYVIEIDSDIFVVDAGLMHPENEMLGIDVVIPDISYLVERADRVKAIFLTHGHDENIGGVFYLLNKLLVPVYGTKLTLALLRENSSSTGIIEKLIYVKFTLNQSLHLNQRKYRSLKRFTAFRIQSESASKHHLALLYARETSNLTRRLLIINHVILAKLPKSETAACSPCFLTAPMRSARGILRQKHM